MSEQQHEGAAAAGAASSPGVQAAARTALAMIEEGMRIGLGSGRASMAFIAGLGEAVGGGLHASGVTTSAEAEAAARAAGIPLTALDEGVELDLTVDGADEVAPNLDLVKGWGGALVRERIVAAASKQQVILVGPEKLVRHIGERGRIPIEVIPMARWPATRRLLDLGLRAVVRRGDGGAPYRTDNGNIIVDCAVDAALDADAARAMERQMLDIAGVVDTGLFLGTASLVIVGHVDGQVELLRRERA